MITTDYISTPGEILNDEFLVPLGISQYRLAKTIGRPQSAISDIIRGKRAITFDMAMLLSRALGTSAAFWMNLETTYALKTIDEDAYSHVKRLVGV